MDIDKYMQETVHKIAVQIGDTREQAFVDAVRKWAAENELNELLIVDEEQLREVLRLGCIAYNELYPGKVGVLYECMF